MRQSIATGLTRIRTAPSLFLVLRMPATPFTALTRRRRQWLALER
jgi:hypothetical protein